MPARPPGIITGMGGRRRIRSGFCALFALALLGAVGPAAAHAQLPAGFSDQVLHRGLHDPTSIAIGSNGVVFVGEKAGRIMKYDGPGDPTPTQVADLSKKVMSAYDRGLEDLVLDPGYPARPYLYVSYTYNDVIGGNGDPPRWRFPGTDEEGRCKPGDPDPNGLDPGIEEGCKVSGRVAQLRLNAAGVVTAENVILEDWCQQFTSHSVGGLAFDPSGALLVGGGEGADYNHTDVGVNGEPIERCDDPPGEGGAQRAQDILTSGDPLGLSGTIARVNPNDGSPAPGNPRVGPGNQARVTSWGLRNPFRLAIRPDTDELWIADVGWGGYEEIDKTTVLGTSNFGWPCFEGTGVQPNYAATPPPLCRSLYADQSKVTKPWYAYKHGRPAVPGDSCFAYEGAISGLAFETGDMFPVPYDDALFASDFVRGCIWSFEAGRTGAPRQDRAKTFHANAPIPVDLVPAPDGMYYADIFGGAIHRISYAGPTVSVNAVSRPRGAPITLAGRLPQGGLTLKRSVAYRVAAPRTLHRGKRTLRFHHWSDGGRRIHQITPDRDRTLRAIYRERKPKKHR